MPYATQCAIFHICWPSQKIVGLRPSPKVARNRCLTFDLDRFPIRRRLSLETRHDCKTQQGGATVKLRWRTQASCELLTALQQAFVSQFWTDNSRTKYLHPWHQMIETCKAALTAFTIQHPQMLTKTSSCQLTESTAARRLLRRERERETVVRVKTDTMPQRGRERDRQRETRERKRWRERERGWEREKEREREMERGGERERERHHCRLTSGSLHKVLYLSQLDVSSSQSQCLCDIAVNWKWRDLTERLSPLCCLKHFTEQLKWRQNTCSEREL